MSLCSKAPDNCGGLCDFQRLSSWVFKILPLVQDLASVFRGGLQGWVFISGLYRPLLLGPWPLKLFLLTTHLQVLCPPATALCLERLQVPSLWPCAQNANVGASAVACVSCPLQPLLCSLGLLGLTASVALSFLQTDFTSYLASLAVRGGSLVLHSRPPAWGRGPCAAGFPLMQILCPRAEQDLSECVCVHAKCF